MFKHLKVLVVVMSLLLLSLPAQAQEVSKAQIKGLDEQIQEVKSDVLNIAAELKQLEEKLLYPSDTQIAVFVSLDAGETARLDSIEILVGGTSVAQHLYSFKEQEALQKGGVQRIYTGNVRTGEHELQVTLLGNAGGSDFQRTRSFKVTKGVGPKIVELNLSGQDIALKDW